MKNDTHPSYQKVLFTDSSTGKQFLIGSTLQPKEKAKYEGKEYPAVQVPTSSASHPFFTKSKQFVDTEGRIDKFKKRYGTPAAKSDDKKEDSEEKKDA